MSRRAAAAGVVSLLPAATLVGVVALSGGAASGSVPAGAGARASPAYAEGAPPGFSGGFGEQSCHACHFHTEENAGPGRLTMADVPESFVAGERYPITIVLTRPDMKLAGFQLTARFKDGGGQAGMLAAASRDEQRIGVEVRSGVQYAGQRHEGSRLAAPDTAKWSLVWTAPNTAGTVVFHVAANAADADGTVEGDDVLTAVIETAASRRR